jgi:hypothetical protein
MGRVAQESLAVHAAVCAVLGIDPETVVLVDRNHRDEHVDIHHADGYIERRDMDVDLLHRILDAERTARERTRPVRGAPVSGETRERAIALLAAHQAVMEVSGYADPSASPVAACMKCGGEPADVPDADRWIAAHQIDMLAAAGIEPFAVDRVVAP